MKDQVNPPRDSRFRERTPQSPIELRDAKPNDVARCLRSLLGMDPDVPAFGEQAASVRRPPRAVIQDLDAGAWIAWCLAGLPLFSGWTAGELPSLKQVKRAAGRFLVALAMVRRGGCLSQAAVITRTSRKVLRDNLKMVGLYPWRSGLRKAA